MLARRGTTELDERTTFPILVSKPVHEAPEVIDVAVADQIDPVEEHLALVATDLGALNGVEQRLGRALRDSLVNLAGPFLGDRKRRTMFDI